MATFNSREARESNPARTPEAPDIDFEDRCRLRSYEAVCPPFLSPICFQRLTSEVPTPPPTVSGSRPMIRGNGCSTHRPGLRPRLCQRHRDPAGLGRARAACAPAPGTRSFLSRLRGRLRRAFHRLVPLHLGVGLVAGVEDEGLTSETTGAAATSCSRSRASGENLAAAAPQLALPSSHLRLAAKSLTGGGHL